MNALASTIDSVTVYRVGARVTRLAELPSLSDDTVVSVPGLPLSIDDDSLRARVVTPAKGMAFASDVRVTLSVERSGEELPAADDEKLESAATAVLEQKALADQIKSELERLSQFDLRARTADADGSVESMPKSPIAGRMALLESRTKQWRARHGELEDAKEELERRRRLVKKLKDRSERATSARAPRSDELRKCAVVSLRVPGSLPAGAQLAIEYRVRGARWAPAYLAHLESDGTSAKLGTRAIVAQRTGEDWTSAKLTLVTASADRYSELPTLASIRIGRRQETPSTGWRPAPAGTDALFSDYERAFGASFAKQDVSEHQLFGAVEDDEDTGVDAPMPVAVAGPPPSSPPPRQARPQVPSAAPAGFAYPDEIEEMPRMAKSRSFFGGGGASPSKKRGGDEVDNAVTMTLAGGYDLADAEANAYDVDSETSSLAPIRADESLLDYDGLVMASPHEPRRGTLVRENQLLRFRSELVRERWVVEFDLQTTLTEARARAEGVLNVAVPSGHLLPDEDDFDYSYFADSVVDVPSDGAYHSIALSSAAGPCELRYQVCPRESTDVFRVARIKNPMDAPLLPGPIDVYLGGEFLLSSQVGFTPPGAVVRFGLGVEQAVRVVRNTSFRDDSAGLLGGSRELHHQIRVEAQNHLERSIELEIRERVPVIREDEDDIRVELGAAVPPWHEFEPGDDEPEHPNLEGGFRWVETLEAAAKVELKASYVVRISSKHELVGGNRRDQ